MNETIKPFPSIELHLENEYVIAHITPRVNVKAFVEKDLEALIKVNNFSSYHFDNDAIEVLLADREPSSPSRIEIGQRLDATLNLDISMDKLQVKATTTPAYGGALLSKEDIQQAISAKGISPRTLINHRLDDLEKHASVKDLVIARGSIAIDGEDARFFSLIEQEEVEVLEEDEHGLVDYYDHHRYRSVNAGDSLMRRTPPTQGKDGINVLGKVLKAKKGKNANFKRSPGAQSSAEDADLLVASHAGHPIVESTWVKVDNIFIVKHADLASGHINFKGSILIKGNVLPQVHIEASGDIQINGSVENATVIAGNNLFVAGGVISEAKPDQNVPPKITSELKAGNEMRLRFVNQSKISCGGDLYFKDYVLNCEIVADGKVDGLSDKGKGIIMGGQCSSETSILIRQSGSDAYIRTCLSCGSLQKLIISQKKDSYRLERRLKEEKQLEQILDTIKSRGSPDKVGKVLLKKARKVLRALESIEAEIKLIKQRLTDLIPRITRAEAASITVMATIYPNTVFDLNQITNTVKEEKQKSTLKVINETIHFERIS